jgi:hypothetical protein
MHLGVLSRLLFSMGRSLSQRGSETVSGVAGGPLAGTAARRRRALAHLSPILDLHLNRSRNPSEVAWSAYDFIALTQLTVDAVALSSGLDGNLGVPRPAVLAEMTLAAATMAPGRPADEHAHVAVHILDHLLRHDEPTPYFQVGYADPDDGWQTTTQPVRVLYETLAADGSTLHVNVDHTAVALLLSATNRSLEDEHEAVIAVMQAQADSGRLDAAIDSAAVVRSGPPAARARMPERWCHSPNWRHKYHPAQKQRLGSRPGNRRHPGAMPSVWLGAPRPDQRAGSSWPGSRARYSVERPMPR